MEENLKQLLLKDLCARLPYGVIVKDRNAIHILNIGNTEFTDLFSGKCNIKPYLRPMSSMTEEEAFEMFHTVSYQVSPIGVDIESDRFRFKTVDGDGHFAGHTVLFFDKIYSLEQFDWLNKHHFDYRGLIERGLALEAPKDMYNTK